MPYNPAAYRNLLRMSHNKRLLVEGKDDKRVFKLLLDEFYEQNPEVTRKIIDIDSAEDLIKFESAPGNRHKVEEICKSVENLPYADNLVGFVDREFREFECGENIQDKLTRHKVEGRLIWSRGHSIENYFFDFSILRYPLRDLSATDLFDKALINFEKVIEPTIRLACAASLTAKDMGKVNAIKDSINWEMLKVNSSGIVLMLDIWENSLVNKKLPIEEAKKIVNQYQIWQKKLETVDFHIVRWLCHGHIGIKFIWAVYSRCIYDVCPRDEGKKPENEGRKPETELANFHGVKETNRVYACASWWARKAIANECDYPIEVLNLLGFDFLNRQSEL